ncbi:MAG: monovalent cation/H(+) antiporter subunit G [Pseudomonadota bacterium]
MSWAFVADVFSWALFVAGGGFLLAGAIGLVRFPDFYTRIHAAGVTDTLGADLILLGMAFQATTWIELAKLFLIAAFMFMTSPTTSHATAHAAWVRGMNPMLGPDLKRGEDD